MLRTPKARALALLLAPVLAGCTSTSVADPAPWAVSFADQGTVDVRLAVEDASGAVALAGLFQNDISLGGTTLSSQGGTGSFVSLLDPHGKPLWASSLASLAQGITGVGFTPDGNLVVAGSVSGTMDLFSLPTSNTLINGDIFVGKVDRSGKPLWVKAFGPDFEPSSYGYATPQGFAIDGDGNVALGGTLYGSIGFGGPPITAPQSQSQTCFVTKLDHDGGHVYDLAFGGYATSVNALAFDHDGALLLGGINTGSLTIGGGTFTAGGEGGYVAKVDRSGAPQWAFQLGGYSEVLALAADPAGNVLVGGRFQGTLQAGTLTATGASGFSGFVLQVSPDGHPAWLANLPAVEVHAIAAAPGGGAAVTGFYYGAPDLGVGLLPAAINGSTTFAARVDGSGKVTAATGFPVPQPDGSFYGFAGDNVTTIGATPSGAVLGGYFGSGLQIGGTTLQASGPSDVFVARVAF